MCPGIRTAQNTLNPKSQMKCLVISIQRQIHITPNLPTHRCIMATQGGEDLGDLFLENETTILSDDHIEFRSKFIDMQRSDKSLEKLVILAKSGHNDNFACYFAIRY